MRRKQLKVRAGGPQRGRTLLSAGEHGEGAVADDDAGVWELIAQQPVLQRRRLGVQLVLVGGARDHGERVSALEDTLLLASALRHGSGRCQRLAWLRREGAL